MKSLVFVLLAGCSASLLSGQTWRYTLGREGRPAHPYAASDERIRILPRRFLPELVGPSLPYGKPNALRDGSRYCVSRVFDTSSITVRRCPQASGSWLRLPVKVFQFQKAPGLAR